MAKNTLLLYFRMLLLLFIGLFTSRIVLHALGVEGYGTYNAVGGLVTIFTVLTVSISSAVSRYMAFELGAGNTDKLRRVFSTSVFIQLALSVILVLLIETAGRWFLLNRMVIPEGSMGDALIVLHTTAGVLVLTLLSVPYNASIISHEKMSAYAFISILEAVLKLAVALAVMAFGQDALKLYAVLMLGVALVVRSTYATFCRRHFEESRGSLVFDRTLVREMSGFAGWNIFGQSAYLFNTQGVNLLSNVAFGVGVNAARGLAVQVEGIVRQFVTNFLTALNPQITKSYASGSHDYTYELVFKGAKYTFLILFFFILPLEFEADILLWIWQGDKVPEFAALFLRLTLLGMMVDLVSNTLVTLVLATGELKKYYLITGPVSMLVFVISWVILRMGAPAWTPYVVFIAIYALVYLLRLLVLRSQIGFPVGEYCREVLVKCLCVAVPATALTAAVWALVPSGGWRLVAVLVVSVLSTAVFTWLFAMTEGEKEFALKPFRGKILTVLASPLGRLIPDSIYIPLKYRAMTGRHLPMKAPKTYNEKLQWLKLHDRRPEYTTMVDKYSVKEFVSGKIGSEHVVPTLAVWDRVEDIDLGVLPDSFVLKCTHDSGSVAICRDKASFDLAAAKAKLAAGFRKNFYYDSREWPYKGVKPRIIAEPYLGELKDYKFFCFDGTPKAMFIATDRDKGREALRFDFFDMDFVHLPFWNDHLNADQMPQKPECFEQMKELAAELSEGIPHVRVDFFETDGRVYFGEMTFFHEGGYALFHPDEWDESFGNYIRIDE